MYPQLANWTTFQRLNEKEYLASNFLTGEKYHMDSYIVRFAKKLNGQRDPFEIGSGLSEADVEAILEELNDKDMLRCGKVISRSFSSIYITAWIPQTTVLLRIVSYIVNKLIFWLWLPILCYSLYHFRIGYFDIGDGFFILGTIIGILIGIIMHELGHMFACLAYGGRVFEIGVMAERFLPGAYVLMDTNPIKDRMQRMQVDAAGIEMNLFLASIGLILASGFEYLSGFFLAVAVNNVFLALLNLLFINGFDGCAIIGEIFGTENVIEKAKEMTKQKHIRKKLMSKGIIGIATIIFCYLLRIFQISLPVVILVNVLVVIGCFI